MQHADYYTHTEETKGFQQEFELAKQRQDQQLESIEKGLSTLKGVCGKHVKLGSLGCLTFVPRYRACCWVAMYVSICVDLAVLCVADA